MRARWYNQDDASPLLDADAMRDAIAYANAGIEAARKKTMQRLFRDSPSEYAKICQARQLKAKLKDRDEENARRSLVMAKIAVRRREAIAWKVMTDEMKLSKDLWHFKGPNTIIVIARSQLHSVRFREAEDLRKAIKFIHAPASETPVA
jgi:hypothetical protein